jgi:hypothetical protein
MAIASSSSASERLMRNMTAQQRVAWETTPRYPVSMYDVKMSATIAACRGGRYADATKLLAESGLAGLFTHCVVRPAAIKTTLDGRHPCFCSYTTRWFPEIGPTFTWIKKTPSSIADPTGNGYVVYYIQTGTCGAHNYYAYEIVPNGGSEDDAP